jgi:hypothetical protein
MHKISEGHPILSMNLNNLGSSFTIRFMHLGDIADLNMAILHQQKAVHLAPEGHPHLPMHLNNLGNSFQVRFIQFNDNVDADHAISAFAQGAQSFGPPADCFNAALIWIQSLKSTPDSMCSPHLKAYTCALHLLPKLAWLGRKIDSRYNELLKARSLACDAAAFSLIDGNIQQSVEWLEQGRSVVWNQTFQLRTPLDDLKNPTGLPFINIENQA